MNPLVALIGWIPFALALFVRLPARRAVIAGFIIGWMFLPVFTFEIHGLPNFSKLSAICLSAVLGVMLFDTRRIVALRPHWIDLPILVWCICPYLSSAANHLGRYDGIASVFTQTMTWGIPYVLGRLYCSDPDGLRDLAIGIVAGGVLYVPFCAIEMVFGPVVHKVVYGYYQHDVSQARRFGGWRPMVFMQHGLMVGVWMTAAAVSALWLWRTRAWPQLPRLHGGWIAAILILATLCLKSVNAWILLACGTAALLIVQRYRTRLPLALLLIAAPLYVAARATGLWTGQQVIPIAGLFGGPRARSVGHRVQTERVLVKRAWHRPLLGWGGWARSLIRRPDGTLITVPDSLWIVAFGERGFVGLISLFTALLLPAAVFCAAVPADRWIEPGFAPAVVLALVLALYAIDNCLNAMINPIYMLACGGLAGLVISRAAVTSEAAGNVS